MNFDLLLHSIKGKHLTKRVQIDINIKQYVRVLCEYTYTHTHIHTYTHTHIHTHTHTYTHTHAPHTRPGLKRWYRRLRYSAAAPEPRTKSAKMSSVYRIGTFLMNRSMGLPCCLLCTMIARSEAVADRA